MAVLSGRAPVSCMGSYAKEVKSYTKGEGSLSLSYGGYGKCHNLSLIHISEPTRPEP